jgi:uncharacterized protein YbaR (Trm112 family)
VIEKLKLVCPVTKQVLRLTELGYLREDGKVYYPVVDGVPVLLVGSGIEVKDGA